MININEFDREIECTYAGEKYSVRDNGAVLRHSRPGKRLRSCDNDWIFGKPCSQKGYLHIAGIVIHRIVATAFHGEPPTKEHVVDHIDTNRKNNLPNNLRWLTRLENVLKNPITVKRIELMCGSIEDFLENPSILGNSNFDPNFKWMRTVTPEEAKACKERMDVWANSDKLPSGGAFGSWLYKPIEAYKDSCKTSSSSNRTQYSSHTFSDFSDYQRPAELNIGINYLPSLTPGAVQKKWTTPTEFPCCPQSIEANPIKVYAEKLIPDTIFARNRFYAAIILDTAIVSDEESILVMCEKDEENPIKPWSLAKITFEDGLYVHTSCGTFFTQEGVEKEFCLEQGLEWVGGDTFDDMCG